MLKHVETPWILVIFLEHLGSLWCHQLWKILEPDVFAGKITEPNTKVIVLYHMRSW